MPRRGIVVKREAPPDPIYQSPLVTKFINTVMKRGKSRPPRASSMARSTSFKDQTKDDPLKAFKKAVDNVKPLLEVKSRRVGGANYQVPVEVGQSRRLSLAIRWLIQYSPAARREDDEKEAGSRDHGRGQPARRRDEEEGRHHKMAEANKAFAHYRW